nr:hypothetical protein Iba_chr10dCG1910 [Ipomoea batatas]
METFSLYIAYLKTDDIVAHRTIPKCQRARATCSAHTPDGCSRSWIKGKEETVGLQVFIKLHPSDARFNHDIHVLHV